MLLLHEMIDEEHIVLYVTSSYSSSLIYAEALDLLFDAGLYCCKIVASYLRYL